MKEQPLCIGSLRRKQIVVKLTGINSASVGSIFTESGYWISSNADEVTTARALWVSTCWRNKSDRKLLSGLHEIPKASWGEY